MLISLQYNWVPGKNNITFGKREFYEETLSLAVMVSATFIFFGFLVIQLASCSSQTGTD